MSNNRNESTFKRTLLTGALVLALGGMGVAHAGEHGKDMSQKASEMADDTAMAISNARKEATLWTTYAFNDHLSAFAIDVEVQGDKAFLTGTVESTVEKDLAEQIALGVDGIAKVDNQLKVDPAWQPVAREDNSDRSFSTAVADATLTAQIKSKLLWNENTDGLDINVDTYEGKVTLRGMADTDASRELAGRLAANTDGVRSVDNELSVDPTVANARGDDEQPIGDAWITAKVKSTLLLSRSVDGFGIDVDTDNGQVKLTGTVDSGAERDLAIRLAEDIKGVKDVDASQLKVS
ncbi:MAG: BON domain-containing protein [Xanthomonadales bacterium]|nr:BON domain-containing protein [Xanthomonadales bacterium]MCB1635163.1 BON domain-containing protein [Xanthomonadales bacterium]